MRLRQKILIVSIQTLLETSHTISNFYNFLWNFYCSSSIEIECQSRHNSLANFLAFTVFDRDSITSIELLITPLIKTKKSLLKIDFSYSKRAHQIYKLSDTEVAAFMGHSVPVHNSTYTQWSTKSILQSSMERSIKFRDMTSK